MQRQSVSSEVRVDLTVAKEIGVATPRSESVVTCKDFCAVPETVWDALMFYEDVPDPPPWFLRAILPRPIASKGRKSEVGNEIECQYETGYLLKRVTRVVRRRSYSFDVIEQKLALRGGIKLLGGSYVFDQLSPDRTRIALLTRYESANEPRWFFRRLEAAVCHLFHRHILNAIGCDFRLN